MDYQVTGECHLGVGVALLGQPGKILTGVFQITKLLGTTCDKLDQPEQFRFLVLVLNVNVFRTA